MNAVPSDPTPSALRPLSPQATSQFDGDDTTWAIAASRGRPACISPRSAPEVAPSLTDGFWPEVPETLADTGLRPTQVEALILKFLLNLGCASGREIASQIAPAFSYCAAAALYHERGPARLAEIGRPAQ